MKKKKAEKRAEKNTPNGSLWQYIDPVTMQPCVVRVSDKFNTEAGWYAALRHPDTDAPQGNCPLISLGARVTA